MCPPTPGPDAPPQHHPSGALGRTSRIPGTWSLVCTSVKRALAHVCVTSRTSQANLLEAISHRPERCAGSRHLEERDGTDANTHPLPKQTENHQKKMWRNCKLHFSGGTNIKGDGYGHAQGGTGRPLTSSEGLREGLERRRSIRLNLVSHFYHEVCRWGGGADGEQILHVRVSSKHTFLVMINVRIWQEDATNKSSYSTRRGVDASPADAKVIPNIYQTSMQSKTQGSIFRGGRLKRKVSAAWTSEGGPGSGSEPPCTTDTQQCLRFPGQQPHGAKLLI